MRFELKNGEKQGFILGLHRIKLENNNIILFKDNTGTENLIAKYPIDKIKYLLITDKEYSYNKEIIDEYKKNNFIKIKNYKSSFKLYFNQRF